jgi:hypothetical protein
MTNFSYELGEENKREEKRRETSIFIFIACLMLEKPMKNDSYKKLV